MSSSRKCERKLNIGIICDIDLKWTAHIETVHKKLIKLTGIFDKIRNELPSACSTEIYLLYAFVQPHILYRVELCDNTYAIHLVK
jgi:hypothetical protein